MGSVLVVDDESTFRASVATLLESAGHVVRTAPEASQGSRALEDMPFDLVLADLHMPGNEELAWVRELQRGARPPRLILVTGRPCVASAVASVNLCVMAYLQKPVGPVELLATVERCLATPLPWRPLARVVDGYAEQWSLTERERDILMGLAQGDANKEVAAQLGISPRTVEVHVSALLRKAGAQSRAELVALLLGTRPLQRQGLATAG